jgi:hypothetical protein
LVESDALLQPKHAEAGDQFLQAFGHVASLVSWITFYLRQGRVKEVLYSTAVLLKV